jgi:hypothetical protein
MYLIKITTKEKSLVKNYMNDSMSFDYGLIEIIVGWELAKSKGASILNHQIDEKTYWTFSPREKRKIFEEDLKKYELLVLNHLKKDKTITNLNPLNFLNSEQFLSYLLNNFYNLNAYLYKESFYFYDINKIYHIDIRLLGFMSWDIIDEIKDIFKIKIIKKEDLTYLKYLDFKYIPYLIDAKENTIISNIPR